MFLHRVRRHPHMRTSFAPSCTGRLVRCLYFRMAKARRDVNVVRACIKFCMLVDAPAYSRPAIELAVSNTLMHHEVTVTPVHHFRVQCFPWYALCTVFIG